MKNKKGFTLIELLAVIVVLAIIALIAVPIVLNIIEKAREGAAIASARSYIKAVETYIVMSDLDKEKESLEAGKTYLTSELDDKVELKGTKPESGNVTISNQNSVANATLVINGYTINYNGLDESYTINNGNAGDNNDCSNIVGLNGIVLRQKSMILGDTKNVSEFKGYVDDLADSILPEWQKKADVALLTTLKAATYTWESSDSSIVSISNNIATAKKEGKTTIIGTTSNGEKVKIPFEVATAYLATEAQVGDYVAYDVSPNSISFCWNENYATSLKGWRVLNIDKSTNTVTIIHAGQPECYYHTDNPSVNYSDASITALNNASQKYLNNDYADSAHAMNYNDAVAITGSTGDTSNNLRVTGAYYWLASSYSSRSLYYVSGSRGGVSHSVNSFSYGVRPVVVLRSNIKTTGIVKDAVGQDAWSLVAS